MISYGEHEKSNVLFQALRRNPTDPVYETDGSTYFQSDRVFQYYNPLAIIDFSDRFMDTDHYAVLLETEYGIIPDLFFNLYAAYNFFESRYTEHIQPDAFPGYYEAKYRNNRQDERFNAAASLKYNKMLGQKHRLAVEAGFKNYQTEKEDAYYNDVQPQHPASHSLRIEQTRLNNLVAGMEYEFGQRYFLSTFINRESHDYTLNATYYPETQPVKSSHWFPSSMIGWKVHNESFMRSLSFLNHLVLKAGYGFTGSHTMPVAFLYSNELQFHYLLDMERTGELSLGLELGLLNDRFRASAVYYTSETGNGISVAPLPVPPSLVSFGFGNNTLITNKGFELMLDAAIISHNKLQWNSGFNYFKNTNELVEWDRGPDYPGKTGFLPGFPGGFQANYTQQLSVGAPPLVFYLPEYAGIAEEGAFLFATPTGQTRYIESASRSVMGQVVPDLELGWWNMLSFNNAFDFSFLIRYVGGHRIYNATRMYLAEPARYSATNVINEAIDFYDEGLKSALYVSDLFLEDASYLRLDNITLGYRVPNGGENRKISARLFLAVNNVLTISEFSGFDPAHDYSGASSGIDYFNRYPLSRSFVVGLNFSL